MPCVINIDNDEPVELINMQVEDQYEVASVKTVVTGMVFTV